MEKLNSQKLISIKKRLEQLSCPYIEDASEHWFAELLLHPSEGRIKLLSWIITNFDSKLGELLDESIPVISNHIDARHQKLLLALNIMSVSKIDDLEVIRGTAPQKKQITFWYELVDNLYTSHMGHPYIDTSNIQNRSYCLNPVRDPNIQELYKESCKFIDTLVRKHKIRDVYCTELHLFSPDLEAIVKEELKNVQIPSLKVLGELGEEMCSDLNELSKKFDVVSDDGTCVIPDQTTVDNYCCKIELSLKTFSQMIDNFLYCHDNDIESWCTKGKRPVLSEIGPSIKSVSNLKLQPLNLMKSVKLYNEMTSYLCDEMKKDLNQTAKMLDTIGSPIDREICCTLQNSICRMRLSSK